MHRQALAICMMLLIAALPACTPTDPLLQPLDNGVSCGADQLQYLVGRPYQSLGKLTLRADTRVLWPREMMSMDYRMERLNIYVDRNGLISRVHCA